MKVNLKKNLDQWSTVWQKTNSRRLLKKEQMGMQAGAGTLENRMEVPQKTKNRTTLWPSNCTTRHLSKGYRCAVSKGTCTPMFIAALSTVAKLWKEPKCPLMDEWIKMWYIYTMECYPAIKKNEILPFATTWMELECITLSEISQSEKDKNHMTSLKWGL